MQSHESFRRELSLPFPLLADTEEKLCRAYGVLVERVNEAGVKSMGLQRSTFLIDPHGVIRMVWPKVTVLGHVAEVLAALTALQA